MKRYDVEPCALDGCDAGMKEAPSGEYMLNEDGDALRIALRLCAEATGGAVAPDATDEFLLLVPDNVAACIARLKAEREAIAARLDEIEKGSWGWLHDDPERTASEFDEWFNDAQQEFDWPDGTIVEWDVIARLRTERYRISRHEDSEDGPVYTYEKEVDRA